jgi:biotin carboxyl carrier protein
VKKNASERAADAATNQELFAAAPTNATPTKAIAEFHRLDKDGNLDRILREMIPKVPAVIQAKARLETARHDLEQAELNLRYCDVVSEIDGVVTSRNVNPGNNVQVGQTLLAVRSLTEIWIDANFKETQLADLRIGQRVKIEVDMYGSRKEYEGRISGFTMGTARLALATAKRHGQPGQDRSKFAGPHRTDRLRPGRSAAVRKRRSRTCTSRNRPRDARGLAACQLRFRRRGSASKIPNDGPFTSANGPGSSTMSSIALNPVAVGRPAVNQWVITFSSCCRLSWKFWIPRWRTWPCGTSPAACPPHRTTPIGL